MRAKFGRGPTVVSKKGSLEFRSRSMNYTVNNELYGFFTDLMDSYGFCSQSLEVWSTQGWHVCVGLIEEYSLSCLCLERLQLRSNYKGLVSFRARVINLFFSISQEDEPQESSYGGTLIVV